jgi:putative heme-binding domain-containing protein
MNSLKSRQRELLVFALILLGVAAFLVARYLKMRQELLNPAQVTLPDAIRTLPGYKVSLLYMAGTNEGSWISMTIDPQGRLIVSPQMPGPLLRLTLSRGKLAKTEQLPQPVGSAMGLLYAKNSLFVDGDGPQGWGVYRMRDHGGIYGKPKLLRPLNMPITMAEHGAHDIIVGPDDKLYLVCGDHTQFPADVSPASIGQRYAIDQLLRPEDDPLGFGFGLPPTGGFVLRMDLNGEHGELFAAGGRNIYQVAFNPDGEMFGFDNDAERDMGLPWYRPTRIYHYIFRGDYGFRQGSAVLPDYYEDTLPSALSVGLGAPTGAKFAPTNCVFPPSDRDALFVADWMFGRILAIHLTPRGATYDATMETILRGTPLNVTAMEFGRDGALYFITGGRTAHSGLYRLTYTGPAASPPPPTARRRAADNAAAKARQLRRQLETFQGNSDPNALNVIWPALGSTDRWIRFAARGALESQDVETWENRALTETNTYGGLTALLALARRGPPPIQSNLFSALEKFPPARLNGEQTLLELRAMELSFIWQGRPSADLAARVVKTLGPLYPSPAASLNHELSQLMIYLNAPDAIPKTLALLSNAPTGEEKIYFAMALRNLTNGWTQEQHKEYLGWLFSPHTNSPHRPEVLQYFKDVGQNYNNGEVFDLFMDSFQHDAAANLAPDERRALAACLPGGLKSRYSPIQPLLQPARPFVKAWRMDDLLPHLSKLRTRRFVSRGRRALNEAQCLTCHRFGDLGGAFAPDLTAVGSRMTPQAILESIIEPSKVVADQYKNTLLVLKDDEVLSGRVIGEDDKTVLIITDPVHLYRMNISKVDIVSRRLSNVSPMPEGLLNSMTEDDIWSLVYCLAFPPRAAADVLKNSHDAPTTIPAR